MFDNQPAESPAVSDTCPCGVSARAWALVLTGVADQARRSALPRPVTTAGAPHTVADSWFPQPRMSQREPRCGWRLVSLTALLGRLSAGPSTRCTPRTVTFGHCPWILMSLQNVTSDSSCRVSGSLCFSFRCLPALSRSRAGRGAVRRRVQLHASWRGHDVTPRDAGAEAGASREGEARESGGSRVAGSFALCSAPAGAACAGGRTSSAGRT